MDNKDNQMNRLKEMASYYEGKGEDQLLKDIFKNVIAQKSNGNLNNEQIKAFAKKVGPLLTAEQRQRLDKLVKELVEL